MKLRLRDWLLSRYSTEKAEDVTEDLTTELKRMASTLVLTPQEMEELRRKGESSSLDPCCEEPEWKKKHS